MGLHSYIISQEPIMVQRVPFSIMLTIADLIFLSHGVGSESIALSRLLHHYGMRPSTQMILKRASVPHALITNMAFQQLRIDLIVASLRRLLFRIFFFDHSRLGSLFSFLFLVLTV